MKVPAYIKLKMRRIASLSRQLSILSREVDDYFESLGYNIESLRSGNGNSLEELGYGNDITDIFCEWIENQ